MYTPPPDLRAKASAQPKEEAIMNTTAAVANQSTPSNKQQKQTAKEVIAANVQALIEQLEQGHSRKPSLSTSPQWAGFTITALATFWRSHVREQ